MKGIIWITNIFKDGFNTMIFDNITRNVFSDTSVNKNGKVKSRLLQDSIQGDFITRVI